MKIITGAQVRMARAFLRWSVMELAEKAGVGKSTVQRIEESDGVPSARIENIQALYEAFVKTGRIRFEGDNGVFAAVEQK
jgi:transcriptional regulator with XRE-family HTH domain